VIATGHCRCEDSIQRDFTELAGELPGKHCAAAGQVADSSYRIDVRRQDRIPGLWHSIIIAVMPFVVGLLLLSETKDSDITKRPNPTPPKM